VELNLFDIKGQLIQQLYKGLVVQGDTQLDFNLEHLPAGTYGYQVQLGAQTISNKLIKL